MPYITKTPASTYEGYLGIAAARNRDGTGVAAVYFKDLASIDAWARDPDLQGRARLRPGRQLG